MYATLHNVVLSNESTAIKTDIILDIITSRKQSINKRNEQYKTALTLAVEKQDMEMIEFFLSEELATVSSEPIAIDKNPKFSIDNDETPIRQAIALGYFEIVQILLPHMKNISVSLFSFACKQNLAQTNTQLVKLLLEKEIDFTQAPDSRNGGEDTWLQLITQFSEEACLELMECLVKYCAFNINEKDPNGKTALMYAVEKAYDRVVDFLINQNADLNATDKEGNTVLHVFCGIEKNLYTQKACLDMVKQLATRDNVLVQNKKKETALMLAANAGWVDVVSFLLDNGAKRFITDLEGDTALHYAIKRRITGEKLVVEGSVFQQGDANEYKLTYAAGGSSQDRLKVIQRLLASKLKNHSYVNQKNKAGQNALVLAIRENIIIDIKTLLNLFLVNRIDLSTKGKDGNTLIHYPIRRIIAIAFRQRLWLSGNDLNDNTLRSIKKNLRMLQLFLQKPIFQQTVLLEFIKYFSEEYLNTHYILQNNRNREKIFKAVIAFLIKNGVQIKWKALQPYLDIPLVKTAIEDAYTQSVEDAYARFNQKEIFNKHHGLANFQDMIQMPSYASRLFFTSVLAEEPRVDATVNISDQPGKKALPVEVLRIIAGFLKEPRDMTHLSFIPRKLAAFTERHAFPDIRYSIRYLQIESIEARKEAFQYNQERKQLIQSLHGKTNATEIQVIERAIEKKSTQLYACLHKNATPGLFFTVPEEHNDDMQIALRLH